MEPRSDYRRLFALMPEARDALIVVSEAAAQAGIEPALIELVKTRTSQINGCAFCLHMHTTDARKHGVSELHLYLLNAWRESPLYSARERAALAWTEALTRITEGHVPDDVYAVARAEFSERELAGLTALVVAINSWNRIAIAYRFPHPIPAAKAA